MVYLPTFGWWVFFYRKAPNCSIGKYIFIHGGFSIVRLSHFFQLPDLFSLPVGAICLTFGWGYFSVSNHVQKNFRGEYVFSENRYLMSPMVRWPISDVVIATLFVFLGQGSQHTFQLWPVRFMTSMERRVLKKDTNPMSRRKTGIAVNKYR